MALTKKDLEMIAEISRQSAVAAVQAMGVAAAPPPTQQPPPPDDDAGDPRADQEVRELREKQASDSKRMRELAEELVPLMIQPRHRDVFEWMAQGSDAGAVIQRIVRAEIGLRLPEYREAMGGGGSSSKDIGGLADRLPPKK